MRRIFLAALCIILISVSVSGCTLQDETVDISITDMRIVETNSSAQPFYGILNLTVVNDNSGKIRVNASNFQLLGQNVLFERTRPKLLIKELEILDNETEVIDGPGRRHISITHELHENVVLLEITYKYDDIEIKINVSKSDEGEAVVTPSFFSTNYFLVVIVLVFGISIALIFLGRSESGPKPGKNECRFCLMDLSDVPEKKRIYCTKWKTRTKRCGEGPFCSQEHLEYHWEDTEHET